MSADRPAKGLGMGLSALLGEAARAPAAEGQQGEGRGGVREIEVARIRPNPEQPRTQFDEESLEELAQSIRERGILQPILLRGDGDGFMIVAGERRWRAAQRAQLHAIPAIVRDIDESTIAELALIENIQREDLNPLEEAEGFRQLIKRHGHTQDGTSILTLAYSTRRTPTARRLLLHLTCVLPHRQMSCRGPRKLRTSLVRAEWRQHP